MLNFTLQQLQIIVTERQEGSFRDQVKIEQFLGANFLRNECLVHLHLENQAELAILEEVEGGKMRVLSADTIMTNFQPGELKAKAMASSMVVGDCFPLIFFDQKSQNMAMVHAGRGPLYLGVLEKTWRKMLELWQSDAKDLWALLGPGIRRESYLIPTEPLQMADPVWQKFIAKTTRAEQPMWQIDLPGLIKSFLLAHGLPSEQFLDSGLDTYVLSRQFFSHRRSQELRADGEKQQAEQEDGRFLVACKLKSQNRLAFS